MMPKHLSTLIVCVGLISPASAQLIDEYGPEIVVTEGFAHVVGEVHWEPPGIPGEHRSIDYVIANLDPNMKQKNVDFPAKFRTARGDRVIPLEFTKQSMQGVDLVMGYAYANIHEFPLAIQPQVLVQLTLEDPARYQPALAQFLVERARELLPRDFRDDALRANLATAIAQAASSPWTRRLLEARAEGAAPTEGANEKDAARDIPEQAGWRSPSDDEARRLLEELLRVGFTDDPLEPWRVPEVVVDLMLYASSSPTFMKFVTLLHLPFILSHRTVGGAAGTEVVVYVDPTSSIEADVYYFYLYTESVSKKVQITGYWLDGATEKQLPAPFEIGIGQYAKASVHRVPHDGQEKWFLTSKDAIVKDDIDTSLDVELGDILKEAHRDACLAGIATSPIDCNGFVLTCAGP